ncbi:MAG: hypothetical protein AB4063_19555 [Crocosphaera sp.]
MKLKKFPARLHILMARNSDQAIIIRRGPSKHTCVIGWERKRNIFQVSQWLKGRIYERRCDISPSGTYWIYFAMNGKWYSGAGSWTAIARVPWLKAIAFFPKNDCWLGGGLFLDDNSYWLNGGYIDNNGLYFDTNEVKRNINYRLPNYYGGECLTVYYNRLQRDGWTLMEQTNWGTAESETIFEKTLSKQWILQKICHAQIFPPPGNGCYWDEHIVYNRTGQSLINPDWQWAEWWDHSIYYAEKGYLYKVQIESSDRLSKPQLLHDFNDYQFEFRQAPY